MKLVIGIVLAIIVLAGGGFLLLSPHGEERASQVTLFPQAGERDLPEMPRRETVPEEDYVLPKTAATAPTKSASKSGATTQSASGPANSGNPLDFLASLIGQYRSGASEPTSTYVPPAPITSDIGVSYTYTPPVVTLPDTGVSYGGGSSGGGSSSFTPRSGVTFNPSTGDITIGGTTYNFSNQAGPGVGKKIGALVGDLVGDASFGAYLGLGLESNLADGRSLSELGISFKNKVPYFGGQNPLLKGGIYDGGGEPSSINNARFSSYTFVMPCTCTSGRTAFYLTTPTDDPAIFLRSQSEQNGFRFIEGHYLGLPVLLDACKMSVEGGSCTKVPVEHDVTKVTS